MRQGMTVVASALLMTLALAPQPARSESEPLPDSRLGIRTAPLLLLSRRDVQADLQLSRTQIEEAEAAIRDLYVKASALRGLTGDKALVARRAIDEQQRQWIDTNLSETQRTRIIQIDLQWEGPTALVSRPAVAEMLELTAEQVEALKKAVAESMQRRAQGNKSNEVEGNLARQTLTILTETQRTRWKAMLGRPFVPQLSQANPTTPTTKQ